MDHRRAQALLDLAVEAAARRGQPDEPAAAALRAASDELDPAARILLEHDPAAALRFVAALGGFWQDAGLVDQGRALVGMVLEGTAGLGAADADGIRLRGARARASSAAAELAFRGGDQVAATALAEEALEAATAVEDTVGAATAWLVLARVAFREGDADRIEAASITALHLAGDDVLTRRGALHMLAWAAHTAGDLAAARERFEASLAYRRSVNAGPFSEAVEIANIADMDLDQGDLSLAARGIREVLSIADALDNRYLIVNQVPSVAALAAAAGRDRDAALLFGVGDALQELTGLTPDPGADRREVRDAVAGRLGQDSFDEAVSEGRLRSREAAMQFAFEICDDVARPPVPAE